MASFDSKLLDDEKKNQQKNEDRVRVILRAAFLSKKELNNRPFLEEEAKTFKEKTSFNEVFVDYVKSTYRKDHTYKPTSDYRSSRTNFTDKTGVDPLNKHYDFAFDNNVNLSGSTWDAKHLDLFLETSPFGKSESHNNAMGNKNKASLSPSMRSLQKKESRSLSIAGSRGSSKKGEKEGDQSSKFFSNKKRLPNNPFVFNDFPAFYSKYASLGGEKPSKTQMEKFFERNFVRSVNPREEMMAPSPLFNFAEGVVAREGHLNYLNSSYDLQSPKERIEELKNTKIRQKIHRIEKEDKLKKQKKFRVIHGAHRSGVAGIDHPLCPNTLLYNGEDAYERFKTEERLKIQERRQNMRIRHEGCHPDIQILNPRSTARQGEEKTIREEPTNILEHSKARVNESFTLKWDDTADRVFGTQLRKFSLARAQFIRSQETRNKLYDIINLNQNKAELKIDKGENLQKG